MKHQAFHYKNIKNLQDEAKIRTLSLPLSERIGVLGQSLHIHGHLLSNRIVIQPMEGCDGMRDGSPDELTRRRYKRFAASGAAIIWWEATAIFPEARANPRQLMLTKANIDHFKAITENIRETAIRENGHPPLLILQITHSGRYSKPCGKPAPLIAYHSPVLEENMNIADECVVSDDYLKGLPEHFAKTAVLAAEAGFDGVDIKACHRYLISELLSAYTRPGLYGGSFENRTRLLVESIQAAKASVSSGVFITTRLNLYDGFPHPYGFGVRKDKGLLPDMTEPLLLAEILHKKLGIELMNFTIGNPYANPHINRPYDKGPYLPPEHPLEGVARMCGCISEVKRKFPTLSVISSGNSYLRHFAPFLAAGMVESGGADMAGFGREAFAYPTFAKDILNTGKMDPKQCCIACSKCTELMRSGSTAGCVVRDTKVYLPIYNRDVLSKGRISCKKEVKI